MRADDQPSLFDELDQLGDPGPAGPGAARRAPGPAQARPGDRERPLSVGDAVRGANAAVDRTFGVTWIEGETTSVQRAASGHIYFCLKDDRAQLRAVVWRSDAVKLRFRIEDGLRVRCKGRLGVYERDGKFQMYVVHAEPAGQGAEAAALDELRKRLAGEGLFDPRRKRALPGLPRRIGLVTSRHGAAVRDVIRVVHRRCPVPILISDTVVQGAEAPRQIVAALVAVVRQRVDVVILGRGGGSSNDLAAFNDERVVRAVAACPVPVISAIGHEVDVSLTDLVADRRAATPSMAGELAVPVLAELSAKLAKEEGRLRRELSLRLRSAHQELDQLEEALGGRAALGLAERKRALAVLERRLAVMHPRARLAANRAALQALEGRAAAAVQRGKETYARRFAALAGRLESLSPLRVLDRGYAIAMAGEQVVTDAARTRPGDALRIRLAAGALDCQVTEVHPASPHDDDPEA